MPKLTEDRDFIQAALEGFKQQRALIDQKMAELRQQLAQVHPAEQERASESRTRSRREVSPEARERMAAAQRRRWARARREKAAQENGAASSR